MSLQRDEAGQLRLALRALSQEEGTSEQAHALEQRLLATLGAEALTAPLGGASTGFGKQWWMLSLGVLIGMSALLGRPHAPPEVAVEQRVAAAPVAPNVVLEPSVVPEPPPQVVVPMDVPSRAPQARATRRSMRRTVAPKASASPLPHAVVAQPEDELALLQRSRSSLRRDPAAALELTEQHARDYPAGVFVQERELLAIQALLKQRRDAEAVARAERFVAEQPTSAYAVRIRELLVTSARVAATQPALAPGGSAP